MKSKFLSILCDNKAAISRDARGPVWFGFERIWCLNH